MNTEPKSWAEKQEYDLTFGDQLLQTRLNIFVLVIFQAYISIKTFLCSDSGDLRLFFHSAVFLIAYYHVARYFFTFITYISASTPASLQYTDGSFWHSFYVARLLIFNTVLYTAAVLYAFKYYMAL